MSKIRWGILGPGRIARNFADALQYIEDAEIYAVGSRSAERASEFAKTYGVKKAYGDYDEFLKDPGIDIVYVATINPDHFETVLLCLNAGKPVLCEKPVAINYKQAEVMVNLAREKGLFMMEAMWTRFLPVSAAVREWVKKGAIGQARIVLADLGFMNKGDLSIRQLNRELGGGALLDLGIYLLAYASMIFGYKPAEIKGMAYIGESGIDEQSSIQLKYDNGQLAILSCAVRAETPQEVVVIGTEGFIRIPIFWKAETASLYDTEHKLADTVNIPIAGSGYRYEAEEAMRCLREGKTENSLMTLDETLHLIKIMDELRAQWNLTYPGE